MTRPLERTACQKHCRSCGARYEGKPSEVCQRIRAIVRLKARRMYEEVNTNFVAGLSHRQAFAVPSEYEHRVSNDGWHKLHCAPTPPREPTPGELLFEFHVEVTKTFRRVELRDHEWGRGAVSLLGRCQNGTDLSCALGSDAYAARDGDHLGRARAEGDRDWPVAKARRVAITRDGSVREKHPPMGRAAPLMPDPTASTETRSVGLQDRHEKTNLLVDFPWCRNGVGDFRAQCVSVFAAQTV